MGMLHVETLKMSIKSVNYIVIKKWKELRKLWESGGICTLDILLYTGEYLWKYIRIWGELFKITEKTLGIAKSSSSTAKLYNVEIYCWFWKY